jgi:hypothetical protein
MFELPKEYIIAMTEYTFAKEVGIDLVKPSIANYHKCARMN